MEGAFGLGVPAEDLLAELNLRYLELARARLDARTTVPAPPATLQCMWEIFSSGEYGGIVEAICTTAPGGLNTSRRPACSPPADRRVRRRHRSTSSSAGRAVPPSHCGCACPRGRPRLPGDGQRAGSGGDFRAGQLFHGLPHLATGDTVRVSMPFRLRVEKAPADPALQTLFHGPVNLVGRNSSTRYPELSLYGNTALSGDRLPSLTPVSDSPLHHRLDGTEFAPFFEGTEDPAHVYVLRSEPRVAFGALDSGVANPARPDGATFPDAVWAGAPFRDKGALTARVRVVVDAWVAEGRLAPADGEAVVRTARKASHVA